MFQTYGEQPIPKGRGSEWLHGSEEAPTLLACGSSGQLVLPAGHGLLKVLRAELPLEVSLVRLRCMQLPLEARLELQCDAHKASGMLFAPSKLTPTAHVLMRCYI